MSSKKFVMLLALAVMLVPSIACSFLTSAIENIRPFPSAVVNPSTPEKIDVDSPKPVPTVAVPTVALKSFDGLPPMSHDCYLGKGGGFGTPGHIYCYPSSGVDPEWDLTALCEQYPGTYVCEWPEVKSTLK